MRYGRSAALTAVLLLLLPALIFAGGKPEIGEPLKGPVTVASKIDTEGALLGQMIVILLEANGFQALDRTEFGPTDVIRKAIISGEIDIYPEYTGNGGFFFGSSDSDIWKNPRRGYEEVKRLDLEANDIVWLRPASANNTWAIAVRRDLAERHKLKTLEDMARYVNAGGDIKLAGSEEFTSRPDSLPAFEAAYGFSLGKDQLLILSGGNTAMTEKAAAEGTDGVNFAMAYGTDGNLAALGLVVLEDTLGVQPVYEPAPIVRREVLDRFPEIAALLEPVFASLDLVTLQSLNARIAVEGRAASEVAREYLASKGFL
jgi:osmoprotectant transport system substrate-binding protein